MPWVPRGLKWRQWQGRGIRGADLRLISARSRARSRSSPWLLLRTKSIHDYWRNSQFLFSALVLSFDTLQEKHVKKHHLSQPPVLPASLRPLRATLSSYHACTHHQLSFPTCTCRVPKVHSARSSSCSTPHLCSPPSSSPLDIKLPRASQKLLDTPFTPVCVRQTRIPQDTT